MKRIVTVLLALMLGLGILLPIAHADTATPTSKSPAVVRAVLFWSKTCSHCREVINNALPPLQAKYGSRLEIQMFELSDLANLDLFHATLESLQVPLDYWGVPLLIVGDQILVGSRDIPERFPAIIEQYLAAGGVDWPPIPGLSKFIETPTPIVPPATPELSTRVAIVPSQPVARAVMFWMNGCPHCEEVIQRVLPSLQQKYGEQLDIRLIEVVTAQDVERLYQIAANFNIPKEQTGVPLLIIGNQALVGSNQIETQLPTVIEKYLAAGGIDLPTIAGLDVERIPPSSPSPICLPTDPNCDTANELPVQTVLRTDPAGFALALIVMLGMVGALVRVAFNLRYNLGTSLPGWINSAIPILLLLGIGIAGYLAYVEVYETSAICGPVGNCNAIQQSPYARLFGVLPVGVLGVLGYLAILGTWVIGQVSRDEIARWAKRAAFALALVGVLFSLYLTFLEPFVIGAVCAWCLSSAVIMTALVLLLVPPAAMKATKSN